MASIFKMFLSVLIPHIIDAVKYLYRSITLKKAREARKKKAKEQAAAYQAAQTDEQIETEFERMP